MMTTHLSHVGALREVVRKLARWVLTSSLGLCAACGTDAGKPDADIGRPDGGDAAARVEADWVKADCSATSPSGTSSPRVLAHVRFTRPLDYAVVLGSFPGGSLPMIGTFPAGTLELDSVGDACASVGSPMECFATLAQIEAPADVCVAERACSPFMVTTRGNKATRIDQVSELVAVLGTIDSEPKAELVAMFSGHTLACPTNAGGQYLSGTRVRADEDGYEVQTEWQVCNAPAFSETLHVDKDGTLIATDNRIVGPTTCFGGP
jgi:hypothetical protein